MERWLKTKKHALIVFIVLFQARLACEEKGVPYRGYVISIHSGEAIEPWYMRIQPNGTVPTLTHGNIVKTDSKDIMAYLDEITPNGKTGVYIKTSGYLTCRTEMYTMDI